MSIILYLPNKQGNPHPTKVPQYIEQILMRHTLKGDIARMVQVGCYRYRIYGYNPSRPNYGLDADIEKLNRWASRYFCPIEDIKLHKVPKNYYVEFTLYDPVAQQFEKHGLIRR